MESLACLVTVHPHHGAMMGSGDTPFDPLPRDSHPQTRAHQQGFLTNNGWASEKRRGPKSALGTMAPASFSVSGGLCYHGPPFPSRIVGPSRGLHSSNPIMGNISQVLSFQVSTCCVRGTVPNAGHSNDRAHRQVYAPVGERY